MTSRPASYRSQPACANCRHSFVRSVEEEQDETYCMLGTSEAFPSEPDGPLEFSSYARYIAAVKAWASRMVYDEGICDEHQRLSP